MEEEKRTQLQKELLGIKKETPISKLASKYGMSEQQILGVIHSMNEDGHYIAMQPKNGEILVLNKVSDLVSTKEYQFSTDDNGEFRFGCLSGLYIGSKYEQPTLVENFYDRMAAQGIRKVFIVGNLTAGLYPLGNKYADTLYLKDSDQQIDHIVKYFPKRDDITTYVVTGKTDEKHLRQVNIGQEISNQRSDIIYLGHLNCGIKIDKVNVRLFSSDLIQTYTLSYRAQQQIVAARRENQADVLVLGGTHQLQAFPFNGTFAITLPSMVAPTPEILDKRRDLVVGDVTVLIRTKNGKLVRTIPTVYQYERTVPNDYQKVYRKGAII